MTKQQYMHSTPKDVRMHIEIYTEKLKYESQVVEYSAWLNGLYVLRAIGNAFSKKSKYPKKPFLHDSEEEQEEQLIFDDTKEYTEEEMAEQREKLMANLRSKLRRSGKKKMD